jgi:hypothetical protein
MIITPPPGTYFIHGLPHWSKHYFVELVFSEVSVSLQKDGHTTPIRPLGFILQIEQGGIRAAYAKDVASKVERGMKVLSEFSRVTKRYAEHELDALIANTPKGKHNELWVNPLRAEIVGGYIVGNGSKSFEKAMKRAGLDVHHISLCDI